MPESVGILHPGEMGISIAASARNGGHAVYWASGGRSENTRQRAEQAGLQDAATLAALCEACQVILSVCPPAAAEDVAQSVLAHGFTGLYVDANAISPQRARRIQAAMSAAGAAYVDGGIIGGPAWQPGKTWLYLSGPEAGRVAALFSAGPLATEVIGPEAGKASALKMCYAAYTKGTSALLAAILAAAEALDVRGELAAEWNRDGSAFAEGAARRVQRSSRKAWRFAGEMEEIAATLADAGLPPEFHLAAAEVYRRLAGFKDSPGPPDLDAVLAALRGEVEAHD